MGNYGLDWINSKPMTKLKKACECKGWKSPNHGPNWINWKFIGYLGSKCISLEPKTKMKITVNSELTIEFGNGKIVWN